MLKAISESRFSECLSITVDLLASRSVSELQREWIDLSASIGLVKEFKSRLAWNDVNTKLLEILEAPKIHVKDALCLTAKLCLLHKRAAAAPAYTSEPLPKMKSRVAELIPDSANLNYTGFNTFSRIMPEPTDDNAIFYGRVLASLSKLATESKLEELRVCFEYLSRKKFKLPLPGTGWPAPSAADNGDPDWFLWGFVLCFYTEPIFTTMYKIYTFEWDPKNSKTQKTSRQGLLWGTPFCIARTDQYDYIWSKDELKVLEQVENMAGDMWKEHTHKPKDVLTTFVSRGYTPPPVEDVDGSRTDPTQDLRQIKIYSMKNVGKNVATKFNKK